MNSKFKVSLGAQGQCEDDAIDATLKSQKPLFKNDQTLDRGSERDDSEDEENDPLKEYDKMKKKKLQEDKEEEDGTQDDVVQDDFEKEFDQDQD